MRKHTNKTIVVIAATAAAVAVSGIAYAWYAAGVAGTGTGTATPATVTTANVTFSASAITGLVPGGPSVTATVTPHNSNAYSVHIPQKTVDVTNAVGTDCTNAQAALSGTGTLTAQTIAAGEDGTPFEVEVSMDDTASDQTSCQGKALTVTYTAS